MELEHHGVAGAQVVVHLCQEQILHHLVPGILQDFPIPGSSLAILVLDEHVIRPLFFILGRMQGPQGRCCLLEFLYFLIAVIITFRQEQGQDLLRPGAGLHQLLHASRQIIHVQIPADEINQQVIQEIIHHQHRVVVYHIAQLLGGVDMDSQHIDIIGMFHRFLPAKYQAHKFTSCFTTAPEEGNSSPNPLSRMDIVMVPSSVKATLSSTRVVLGGRSAFSSWSPGD